MVVKAKKFRELLACRSAVNLTVTSPTKASVLLIVLWVLCLLSTFAVILGYGVRQKLELVKRLDEQDKLAYIAEAGAKKAISELKSYPALGVDAFRDAWNNNPLAFSNIPVGGGQVSVSYEYLDDAVKVTRQLFGIVDEERKININKADPTILKRLFQIVLRMEEPGAQELTASIVDWRSKPDEPGLDQMRVSTDSYYMNLQYPYAVKHANFELTEELLLVKGMNNSLFQNIKDYITVYGDGKVNINTASASVLCSLGLSADIVEKIISYRNGKDQEFGTADDNVFDTASAIAPALKQAFQLSDSGVAELDLVAANNLCTNSNNFLIQSAGSLPNRNAVSAVNCVVNRQGKILYWQEK